MAYTLSNANFQNNLYGTLKNSDSFGVTKCKPEIQYSLSFPFGTAVGECDQIWGATRTIASHGSDTLNLISGGLPNGLGGVVTMNRVRAYNIVNLSLLADQDIAMTGFGYDEYYSNTIYNLIRRGGSAGGCTPDGWELLGPDNHIIVDNLSGETVQYEIVVLGSSI